MRLGIVNDSALAVEVLRRVVSPHHDVAWIAVNGRLALEACLRDRPDIVLMDLFMPVMNGLEATRRIMESTPCAILVVTATVDGHASMVFEAMGQGALDVIATPVLREGEIEGAQELLHKIDIIGRLMGHSTQGRLAPVREAKATASVPLYVLGSSTGGPKALATILQALPASFGGSLIIVQHIDMAFAEGMAQWLDNQTALTVRPARRGDAIVAGQVLVAAQADHLVMTSRGSLDYDLDRLDGVYKPSIDRLFESVSLHWPQPGVAVLLTGMGQDGVKGMLALRRAGWRTIAQDEATSVIYGMPKAALESHAAAEALAVDRIAPALISHSMTNKGKQS